MPGSGESFPPYIQGSGGKCTCVPYILPNSFVIQRSVPVHGITQLGLRSHPTGSVTHETLTATFSFVRHDKLVYTTVTTTWGIPRFRVFGQSEWPSIMALHYWVSVLWGRQVMIATDNTTVVAYINKQGVTHSHTLLRLVVDLFLWLQTQNRAIWARHILGCLNVIADQLSQPNQPITTEWSLHP